MGWRGCELHYVRGTSDKFYRIIQSGRVVVIRHGRRGAEGRLIVRSFDGEWEARDEVEKLIQAKAQSHNYDPVYNDPDESWAASPQDPKEIEAVFLSRWRDKLAGELGQGSRWAVVSGLVSVGTKNMGTACLLEQALSGLHVRDDYRDLMVTRANETWQGTDPSGAVVGVVAVLGDYDEDDSEAVLNAALSLYSPEHPEPRTIMSVARLLTAE